MYQILNFSALLKLKSLVIALALLFSILSVFGCGSVNSAENVQAQTADSVAQSNKSAGFDHSKFEELLKIYVDDNGLVDYTGFAKDSAVLDAYLETIANVDPRSILTDDERNAFYINAYNAYTIKAVLNDVIGKTDSVKKVNGFWDKKKYRIAGEEKTLDSIEKVSRDLKDPRMHFAVNCASLGCPKLQKFAFTGEKLKEQFQFITQDFLKDQARGFKIDPNKNKVWISRIFSWYAGDFSGDTSKVGFVKGFIKSKFSASAGSTFILENGPEDIVKFINDKKPDIGYLEYDWTLNSQIPPAKSK